MRLYEENLRGRTAIAADGQMIGEVAAVVVDTDDWRVDSLQVKLRKDVADRLGAERSVFRAGELEVPTRLIQSVGDTVLLSVPVDGLREMLSLGSPESPPQ